MPLVQSFKELRVFQLGFGGATRIFELSKSWPKEERYALTDQIRRSSRSACANIGEAWRKRRYVPSFVNKLSDADAEAAETQIWLDFALASGYIDNTLHAELYQQYDQIIGGLVKMMADPASWCGPSALKDERAQYHVEMTDG